MKKMDLKIVFLCIVCVAAAAGSAINTGRARKSTKDNLTKGKRWPLLKQVPDRDRRERNLLKNGRLAIRILENIVEDIVNSIQNINDGQLSGAEISAFIAELGDFLDDAQDLEDGLQDFLEKASAAASGTDADSGTSTEETTTETTTTTEASTATEESETDATTDGETTTQSTPPTTTEEESTTQGSPDTTTVSKRLLNLRKTLLRALLANLKEKSRK